MMTKIFDFATRFDDKLWDKCLKDIAKSSDPLKNNYIGLEPTEFTSFPVVIIDDKIVCFSALQINEERWGKGIGRCSSRLWIHPEYRHTGKFTGGDKFLNTTYCLPIQLAAAKLHNLDCIFISREHNLLGFVEYAKLIKINCNTNFYLESTRYNVCGSLDPIPESCKQWVMVHHLTTGGSALWEQQMKKFILFENTF
jgi:hypothetical protein